MSDIMKILTELKDFKAPEVSYVPNGAVRKKFLIIKEDDVGKKELAKLIEGSKLENLDEIKKTLEGSKIDASKVDAITGGLRIFSVLKEEIGEEALTSVLNLSKVVKEEDSDDDDDKKKAFEEMTAKVAKLEEDNSDLKDQVEKALASKPEPKKGEPVDIMKSLPILKDGSLDESKIPEELRGAVTHLFKANKASADLIATVEKNLAEERDIRITKAYQEKAATYGNIKVDGLATVLKDVAASSPETFKVLESILKVANDGLAPSSTGAFGEIGSSRTAAQTDSQSAEQIYKTIETEADAAIEGDKTLIEKMDLFMTGNERGQALYTQYQDKIRRG